MVSIVLPTYNGSRYLARSLVSCLCQSYSEIEVIAVNDGSTDDTLSILLKFAEKDSRLRVINLTKNVGLPRALNAGFEHARGEFLTWTSDDNYYAENAIEEMVKFLEAHPEIDFVYTDYIIVDEEDRVLGYRRVSEPESIIFQNIVGPCFLYRRRVYERLGGYDPNYALAEDYEYWLRVLCHFRALPLHRPLYYYRRHRASLSTKFKDSVRRVRWQVQWKWLPLIPWITKQQRAKVYLSLGAEAFRAGNRWQAIRCLARCLHQQPTMVLNPLAAKLLAKVLLPPPLIHAIRIARDYLRAAK